MTTEDEREIAELYAAYPTELAYLRASDKQRKFQQAFLTRRDPDTGRKLSHFCAMGANRSGKTIVAGWLCFATYIRYFSKDGDWFWLVGQNLDRSIANQQQEVWKALPRWMFGEQLWTEKLGFGTARKITLPTADGGRCLVEFRSADQQMSTFESAKLTGCWVDERCPEALYDRLIPRLIDRDGWLLYSDIPEQFWQLERLANAPPDAGVYFQHMRMRDNEHNLPPGAIVQAAAQMTEDQRKMRIEGEFMVMEGLVYKEYVDSIHAIDPFVIPDAWPRWRNIDYGGSAPTACLWITIAPNETAFVYREHYEKGGSIINHARKIHVAGGATYKEYRHPTGGVEDGPWLEITATGGEKYRQTFIDPHAFDVSAANEVSIGQQYKQSGIPCLPWPYVNVMGEHAMVQKVKFRLERKTLFVFKSCTQTRREFRSWKYKCDKDGNPVAADAFDNANNHALDCIKGFVGKNPCYAESQVRASA